MCEVQRLPCVLCDLRKTQAADTPTERLVKAARSGSLMAVMRILQTGVDPNEESHLPGIELL